MVVLIIVDYLEHTARATTQAKRVGVASVHYLHHKRDALPVGDSPHVLVTPHRVDLADAQAILEVTLFVKPDAIIHLAALSNTTQCEAVPVLDVCVSLSWTPVARAAQCECV